MCVSAIALPTSIISPCNPSMEIHESHCTRAFLCFRYVKHCIEYLIAIGFKRDGGSFSQFRSRMHNKILE